MTNFLTFLREGEWLLDIINLSLEASFLIAAVCFLRYCFRNLPKGITMFLWALVALKLVVPFSVASSFSLIPDKLADGSVVDEWTDDYIRDTKVIFENQPEYSAAVEQGFPVYDTGDGGSYVVTSEDGVSQPLTVKNFVIPLFSAAWVAMVLSLLFYTLSGYLKLRKSLKDAVCFNGNIYQSKNIEMPFVFGIFSPKIYLPFTLQGESRDYVIAHEQTHIKRRDYLWKPLGFLLLTIHWFNPLVWLSYMLLCKDIELACDEKVIKDFDREQLAGYSEALLLCSIGKQKALSTCPLAFGEIGVKERVQSILSHKKPAFGAVAVAVIVCGVTAVCFLTSPKTDITEQEAASETVIKESDETTYIYKTDEDISGTDEGVKSEFIISADESIDDILANHLAEDIVEIKPLTPLTMEILMAYCKLDSWDEILKTKKLDFFAPFDNKRVNIMEDSLTDSYHFDLNYNDKSYELIVSYWKPETAEEYGHEKNEIDFLILCDTITGDIILLYSSAERFNADNDIESFLSKEYSMEQYLSFTLPEGMEPAPYKTALVDRFEGCFFTRQSENAGGTRVHPITGEIREEQSTDSRVHPITGEVKEEQPHGEYAPEEWYAAGGVGVTFYPDNFTYENGKLIGVSYFGNHMSQIGDFEVVEMKDFSAILGEYEFELFTAPEIAEYEEANNVTLTHEDITSSYWYVFFGNEGENKGFVTFFNQDIFIKDEVLTFVQGIRKAY